MLALDVVEDILLTLDVEDLLRCKSVCKSWYSFISSPLFVKLHLKFVCNKEEKYNKQLGNRRIYLASDIDNIEGSSNGLVCISSIDNYQICLNNPSTREFRILQQPIILPNSNNGWNARRYGFGYDSSANDYKVVMAINQGHYDRRTLVHILSLKSNVWKLFGHVNYSFYDNSPGILFNGALHWFWLDADDNNKKFIMCFDLAKEEFREIPQPEDPRYDVRYNDKLGIFEDHLCIFHAPGCHPYVMWVMKNYNVKQSWELLPTDWAMKERLQCMNKDWRTPPKTLSYFCSDKTLMYLSSWGLYMSDPIFVQTFVSPYVNDNERPSVAKNNKRTVKSARHKLGFAYAGKKKEIDDSRSKDREERRRERGTKTIQSVNSRIRRGSRVG